MDGLAPRVTGCPECDAEHGGVKTEIVLWWPEAWRAVARKLDERGDGQNGGTRAPSGQLPKLTS